MGRSGDGGCGTSRVTGLVGAMGRWDVPGRSLRPSLPEDGGLARSEDDILVSLVTMLNGLLLAKGSCVLKVTILVLSGPVSPVQPVRPTLGARWGGEEDGDPRDRRCEQVGVSKTSSTYLVRQGFLSGSLSSFRGPCPW